MRVAPSVLVVLVAVMVATAAASKPCGKLQCPMSDGVCCQDMQHCCPHGYLCTVNHPAQCLPADSKTLPIMELIKLQKLEERMEDIERDEEETPALSPLQKKDLKEDLLHAKKTLQKLEDGPAAKDHMAAQQMDNLEHRIKILARANNIDLNSESSSSSSSKSSSSSSSSSASSSSRSSSSNSEHDAADTTRFRSLMIPIVVAAGSPRISGDDIVRASCAEPLECDRDQVAIASHPIEDHKAVVAELNSDGEVVSEAVPVGKLPRKPWEVRTRFGYLSACEQCQIENGENSESSESSSESSSSPSSSSSLPSSSSSSISSSSLESSSVSASLASSSSSGSSSSESSESLSEADAKLIDRYQSLIDAALAQLKVPLAEAPAAIQNAIRFFQNRIIHIRQGSNHATQVADAQAYLAAAQSHHQHSQSAAAPHPPAHSSLSQSFSQSSSPSPVVNLHFVHHPAGHSVAPGMSSRS